MVSVGILGLSSVYTLPTQPPSVDEGLWQQYRDIRSDPYESKYVQVSVYQWTILRLTFRHARRDGHIQQ